MTRASDAPTTKKHDYVVPAPRVTDAMGRALRRAFVTRDEPVFGDLLTRLDAVS